MANLPATSEPNPTSQQGSPQTQPIRIHFPDRFLTTRTHGDSSRSSSISFPSPAHLMLQSRSDNRASMDLNEGRRHVRSLGPGPIESGSTMPKNTSPRHYGSRRKKNLTQSQGPILSPLKADSFMSDFEPTAFSDEYDLCELSVASSVQPLNSWAASRQLTRANPKILQDVQRALHLQSRRRGRMLQQVRPTPEEVPSAADISTNTSTPYASMSTAPPVPHSSQQMQGGMASEVDFSPSTRSVPNHPVPLSSNGGATLDWTGFHSEDEKSDKRWSISRGKRSTKERMVPSAKAIVEKQEALFADKISRIRAEASAPTVRKAAIVSEQLERRYNILYPSIASEGPVNLVQVARWHAGLGTETQAWLESAEPLTWLKHLLDRHGRRRSQWHVSALVIEEYIKFRKGITSCTLAPESPVASSSLETPSSQKRLRSVAGQVSGPPSDPLNALGRVRSSDGSISFGPVVASSHDSLNSPQNYDEGKARGWRHSMPPFFDSASVNSTSSPYRHRNSSGGLSPTSSRLNFPEIIHRFRRHPVESEEGSTSPFGSQSEDQNDSALSRPRKSKRKGLSHPAELQSLQGVAVEMNMSNDIPEVYATTPFPAESTATPALPSHPNLDIASLAELNHSGTTSLQCTPLYHRRSYRSTSLPAVSSTCPILPESKEEPDEESGVGREYELKLRTLEELRNHNHRLRHRMQRVAVDVREYELVCSNVMSALGIAYRSLPVELLDAFNHDPSAVTNGTRRRHGWRIVEDIHARVLRQREIVTSFLSGLKISSNAIPITENVLDRSISTLMEKLQALENEQEPLQEQADEVSRMLTEVRASHMTVKEEYNDALSYTSVVYPEFSRIVALEESYRDQYQQIWELAMDALTFILDTIAPFWRSYGKIIGEDMQDFVIIPWYRNEFTGESKRYAVQSVPRRSLRHWIALFCLGALTFFATFLQGRAAITLTWHYRLLWIDNQALRWAVTPFFWVVILIQWLALVFEACVVLLHIAVVAWWLGWFIGICT